MTTATHFYGKYIKHSTDKFNNEKELFVVLKDKGFEHQKSIYEFNDNWFANLKSRLFNGITLETNKVYAIAVGSMSSYMGHDYIANLRIQLVPEAKTASLLKKYQKEIVEQMITQTDDLVSEDEETDDEDEEEEVVVVKPKKKRKRKLKE